MLLSSLISLVVRAIGAAVGIAGSGGTDTALVDDIYSTNTAASSFFIIIYFQVFFLPLAVSALFSDDMAK